MENHEQKSIDAVNFYLTTNHNLSEVVERFGVSSTELFMTMLNMRRPPPEDHYRISTYLANLDKALPEQEE